MISPPFSRTDCLSPRGNFTQTVSTASTPTFQDSSFLATRVFPKPLPHSDQAVTTRWHVGFMTLAAGVGLTLAMTSCATPTVRPGVSQPSIPAPPAESLPETMVPGVTVSPGTVTLDLDHRPLIWFGPLPPMPTGPGRPFTGSDDFMALFSPGAAWAEAASHIQVFKLYGEWVVYDATDAQLQQVVAELRRRNLALAVEAGPLTPTAACGQGIESFAGIDEGRLIARRIRAAGGAIQLLALDEPLFFAHFYDGDGACNWTPEAIAQRVDAYIRAMRSEFPGVIVGDTEPLAGSSHASDYIAWLTIFRTVAGYDLGFLHIDVDWGRPQWAEEVKAIEDFGSAHGIPIGLIYTGNPGDPSDEAWLAAAGERVKTYELETGGRPAHVVFQSWNDHPDRVLPESEANTFTDFIRRYFEDKSALGFRREGKGANLALEKAVRASRFVPGNEAALAVDGNPGTWWSAGAGPSQWIEIDLGKPYDIEQIRLTPSQYPAGATTHRVLGKGTGTSGVFKVLQIFQGKTQDGQALIFSPQPAWQRLEVIRIETVASPSWVAWREIEVIDAGG